jgi:Zn-dependent peptidase ImmA (M78 family)
MAFGGVDVPVPVEGIAQDLLGLHVELAPLADVSGMLIPAERRVLLNQREREYAGRCRFTLAHELGHWICHCLGGQHEPVYCRARDLAQDADRDREREANVFAAELLMPERAVREGFVDSPSCGELAGRFAVSDEAMSWRLFNCGLAERPGASPASSKRDE